MNPMNQSIALTQQPPHRPTQLGLQAWRRRRAHDAGRACIASCNLQQVVATLTTPPTACAADRVRTKGKGKKIKNLLQATTNPMKQCHKLAVNGKWVTKVCTCSSLPRFYCDDGCFLKAQWVRRDPRTRCSRECGGGWQTYNYRCEGYWYQQTCGGSWSQLSAIYVMRITCYPLEVELAQRLF